MTLRERVAFFWRCVFCRSALTEMAQRARVEYERHGGRIYFAAHDSAWKKCADCKRVRKLAGWLLIETLAGCLTLAGVLAGTTTLQGAALYAVALPFWFWLCVGKRLWGLMPLNAGASVIAGVNLWRVVAA